MLKRNSKSVSPAREERELIGNPVVHFEIIGENMRELFDFYRSVFDWWIDEMMDEYSLVSSGSGLDAEWAR